MNFSNENVLFALACLFLLLGCLLQGCDGQPDVFNLSLEPYSHASPGEPVRHIEAEPDPGPLGIRASSSIGVEKFKDSRRETAFLGMRSSRWGIWDSCIFSIEGGDLGKATAKALSRHLESSGWRIRMIDEEDTTLPKVVVTGEIIEMQVNASSTLFSTHVTASVILLLNEEDRTTGKRSSARLIGSGSRNVLWFDPEDAEFLLKDSLTEAFRQWSPGMDGNKQMVGSRPEAD